MIKLTTDFEVAIAYEDGKLYISEENGSGVSYRCETADDAAEIFKSYITTINCTLFD